MRLLRALSEQSSTLIAQELALARWEMRENLGRLAAMAGWLGAGILLLILGLGALTAAAILGLGDRMPLWQAATIVGTAQLILGLGLVWISRRKRGPLIPERTLASLRDTLHWAGMMGR